MNQCPKCWNLGEFSLLFGHPPSKYILGKNGRNGVPECDLMGQKWAKSKIDFLIGKNRKRPMILKFCWNIQSEKHSNRVKEELHTLKQKVFNFITTEKQMDYIFFERNMLFKFAKQHI